MRKQFKHLISKRKLEQTEARRRPIILAFHFLEFIIQVIEFFLLPFTEFLTLGFES